MRTLLLACGNALRCDDGVAAEVLQLIGLAPDRELRAVQQLTPECAELISRFARVVFIDADASCAGPVIEPVSAAVSRPSLSHASSPAEIVALAQALFAFTGEAWVCRIPARDFSPAERLSPAGLLLAQAATSQLEHFL